MLKSNLPIIGSIAALGMADVAQASGAAMAWLPLVVQVLALVTAILQGRANEKAKEAAKLSAQDELMQSLEESRRVRELN